MAIFQTNPVILHELLVAIKAGDIQLPDFQRSWVWSDEQICRLLASVSLSHPIGALMMLGTGNPQVKFSSRLLEGVVLSNKKPQAKQLILDGQQRLTSLFLSLLSKVAVDTTDAQNKPVKRWYYIDINKAIDPKADREEAIISLPDTKQKTSNFGKEILLDLSNPQQEYLKHHFPVNQIYDYFEWKDNYDSFWKEDRSSKSDFNKFIKTIIQVFQLYQIPIITLNSDTPREAICQVFENVNKSGVSLTVFELLTATFAVDEFKLREDWEKREKKLKQQPVLKEIKNTDFLQAVALIKTYHKLNSSVSCKRKDILQLNLIDYKDYADKVMIGFEKVADLLEKEKIFYSRDLPYQTQPIALAAIYAILGELADSDDIKAKLLRWYWCGVFGEIYGGGTESRLAKDVSQVIAWTRGRNEPDTIQEANFVANRILELCTRNSAAYKGLAALISQSGCHDFRTGLTIEDSLKNGEFIDIHHIFPKKWCEDNKLTKKDNHYDCIVNKTPLTAITNRRIGDKKPSKYISTLQNNPIVLEQTMNERLKSHFIEPSVLRADDYQIFFEKRKEALLDLIEKAMGKSAVK